MAAKPVTLYPSEDGTFIAGVPSVAMTVNSGEAKRLLKFSPPAFTDKKSAGFEGEPEDFSGRISDLLGDESAAVDAEVFAPEPSPSPGSSGEIRPDAEVPSTNNPL